MGIKRSVRQPSIDCPGTPFNDFEGKAIKGSSTVCEVSKNENALPAPEVLPEKSTSTSIVDLPRELRDHLIGYLSPSSAVALKLSCRSLYHSGPALPVLSYLARKTPEDRYEWIMMQERLGRREGKLACSGCKQLHDIKFFPLEEREKQGERRLCIGRLRVLYLNPHRYVPFRHFEENAHTLLRDKTCSNYAYGWFFYLRNGEFYELIPGSIDTSRFPLVGHYHWTKHSKGVISLSACLTIRMESVDPEIQTCASIYLELQKYPFTLCRHLTSATEEIAKAIHEAQRRSMRKAKKKRRVRVQCPYCDCRPRVEINDACTAVIIYARRSIGRVSATASEWLEQAE